MANSSETIALSSRLFFGERRNGRRLRYGWAGRELEARALSIRHIRLTRTETGGV
jgi:hypothetical protein